MSESKRKKEFRCNNCGQLIFFSETIGTAHRNHCPFCLTSKHLDSESGDRKSRCQEVMKPIALTFKHEGEKDKYGNKKRGELMVIHECQKCGKISINRIAGDDNPDAVFRIFKESLNMNFSKINSIENQKIDVSSQEDEKEIKIQLFGKTK